MSTARTTNSAPSVRYACWTGPGYATADTIQRRFLETSAIIVNGNDTITVVLKRRACSPVSRRP